MAHVIVGDDQGGEWRFAFAAGGGPVLAPWHGISLVRGGDDHAWVHFGAGQLATTWRTPFEPQSGVLRVALSQRAKAASVRTIPAGLECPGACEASFAYGT